ncbi:MAG: hypothetical protein HY675_12605 [Chloroflexi bacterium]|nr:hypothetical protein [Chloroflexota bacterium]
MTTEGSSGMPPIFEVVSPVGEPITEQLTFAPPVPDLSGKTIGFIWCRMRNGDVLADDLTGLLAQRVSGVKFVKLPSGTGVGWGQYPDKGLVEVVRTAGVDAAIVVIGC